MRIETYYSHLNGLEYLLVHKPELWQNIVDVIADTDADRCKTKVSKEKGIVGKMLYSPIDMNKEMRGGFSAPGVGVSKEHPIGLRVMRI